MMMRLISQYSVLLLVGILCLFYGAVRAELVVPLEHLPQDEESMLGRYRGEVKLGVDQQPFSMQFSTGSGDLWVQSSRLGTHLSYIHYYNQSSTYEAGADAVNVQLAFIGYSVTVLPGLDSVTVGSSRSVGNQVFGEAVIVDAITAYVDGFVGLGFTNMLGGTGYLDTLKNQGVISTRRVAFQLQGDSGSELVLGAANDDDRASRGMTWLNVAVQSQDEQQWRLSLTSVSVNQYALGVCTESCAAIIDTSSPFIRIPASQYSQVLSNWLYGRDDYRECGKTGSGLLCLAEQSLDAVPDLGFVLDGEYLALKPEDCVEAIYDADTGDFMMYKLLLVSWDSGLENVWILGEPFVQTSGYVVFDMDSMLIGLQFPVGHLGMTWGLAVLLTFAWIVAIGACAGYVFFKHKRHGVAGGVPLLDSDQAVAGRRGGSLI